ncbi:MBOAT family protein [bacterium]|nr:MBOAT family protein [bacterium]
MLFPTVQFAIFFPIVFLGNWLLMQHKTRWRVFMLIASYYFYGSWDWRFMGLLAGVTIVNQGAAMVISRAESQSTRRWALIGALTADLGALAFFKYYGFFVTSVTSVLGRIGLEANPPLLEVILPVGISFFTFQAISYVIDVYRGDLQASPWLDAAVYLAFFPQLVAGPIVRGTEFLPQLNPPRDPRRLDTTKAFYLIAIGLAKKVVIADFLATNIVDQVFAGPQFHGGLEILIAMYAYSVQIYADFSAYSDIAIGVSLLLGFKLPDNFNSPYAALNVRDFWRRWHMTLSRWLRDYLYVPLGGNRGRSLLTYRNLMLTMLLGGLWHGAAWRFVVWGGLHAIWLTGERMLERYRDARNIPEPDSPIGNALRRIWTFHLITIAWVFFRADSVGTALELLGRVVTAFGAGATLITPGVLLAIAVGIGAQYVSKSTVNHGLIAFSRLGPAVQGLALAFTLVIIDALGPEGVAAFIYFQF